MGKWRYSSIILNLCSGQLHAPGCFTPGEGAPVQNVFLNGPTRWFGRPYRKSNPASLVVKPVPWSLYQLSYPGSLENRALKEYLNLRGKKLQGARGNYVIRRFII
jgi:hypothetical protein